jgi:hypothetical protein
MAVATAMIVINAITAHHAATRLFDLALVLGGIACVYRYWTDPTPPGYAAHFARVANEPSIRDETLAQVRHRLRGRIRCMGRGCRRRFAVESIAAVRKTASTRSAARCASAGLAASHSQTDNTKHEEDGCGANRHQHRERKVAAGKEGDGAHEQVHQ